MAHSELQANQSLNDFPNQNALKSFHKRYQKAWDKQNKIQKGYDDIIEQSRIVLRQLIKSERKRHNVASRALFEACRQNDAITVAYYLRHGADITNRNNKCRKTPLHVCASHSSTDCAELLFEHLLNYNEEQAELKDGEELEICQQRDKLGFMPIHLAVLNKSVGVVKLIAEYGPETLNTVFPKSADDLAGLTPLHYAVIAGCDEIIKELCIAETEFLTTDSEGKLPIELDCSHLEVETWDILAFHHMRAILQILSEPSNCQSRIKYGNVYLQKLLSLGWDIDQFYFNLTDSGQWVCLQDEEDVSLFSSYTLLMWAIKMKRQSTVELLINANCDVNKGNEYVLPIHLALDLINTRDEDILHLLLEAGVDVNRSNMEYDRPMFYLLEGLKAFSTNLPQEIHIHRCILRGIEVLLQNGALVNTDMVEMCIEKRNVLPCLYMLSAGARFPETISDYDFSKFVSILRRHCPFVIDALCRCGGAITQRLFDELEDNSQSDIPIVRLAPLKYLAINVVRTHIFPNAWCGVNFLGLPPGFNKQELLINIQRMVELFLPVKQLHPPRPPLHMVHPSDIIGEMSEAVHNKPPAVDNTRSTAQSSSSLQEEYTLQNDSSDDIYELDSYNERMEFDTENDVYDDAITPILSNSGLTTTQDIQRDSGIGQSSSSQGYPDTQSEPGGFSDTQSESGVSSDDVYDDARSLPSGSMDDVYDDARSLPSGDPSRVLNEGRSRSDPTLHCNPIGTFEEQTPDIISECSADKGDVITQCSANESDVISQCSVNKGLVWIEKLDTTFVVWTCGKTESAPLSKETCGSLERPANTDKVPISRSPPPLRPRKRRFISTRRLPPPIPCPGFSLYAFVWKRKNCTRLGTKMIRLNPS